MKMGLNQILDAFERAAEDDQIEGVLLNVGNVSAMPAMMEDLRAGLEILRDSNKFIVAWSEIMSQRACISTRQRMRSTFILKEGWAERLRSQSMFYPGMFESSASM